MTDGAAKLDTATVAVYAAPNLALAALYFPVFVYLPPFYAAQGVDLFWLGAVLLMVRGVDALSDPLAGLASDRLRLWPGMRRKPWLALATPLVCASVWMAMVPPEPPSLAYIALWLTALTLAWTLAITPYTAWGAELATDYRGRTRIASWRESAFLLGTLGAAVLYSSNEGAGSGLRAIAIAVCLALPVLALIALWRVPEPRDRSRHESLSLAQGWRAIRANAPFRVLLLAYFLNSAANALPAALFLFFVEYRLGLDDQIAGALLALYFLAGVLAAPLWNALAARLSKHRTWAYAMLYACAIFALVPFLGEGDLWPFVAITALTGLAFGADIVLPPAIQADVIDVDTAATGQQRTGLYMAIWTVATKAAQGITGALALFALSLAGFSAQGENAPSALLTLTLLYALVPIALKLAAIALSWRFTLDERAQTALRAQIEEDNDR